MATKCGRLKILSYCGYVSVMLPLASTTVRQSSHLASTPISLYGGFAPRHSFGPSSGSWPEPPAPGIAAAVASRHGRRPMGKERLGARSASLVVLGRGILGNSPRERRKTRLGLSAKIPWPAPQVHLSFPGTVLIFLGQSLTIS